MSQNEGLGGLPVAAARPPCGDASSGATPVPCLIYDDPRPIAGLFSAAGGGDPAYRVGRYGVTRIVAYREHGQGDFVPFFAVYRGDELAHRVPAHMVEVGYDGAAEVGGRS